MEDQLTVTEDELNELSILQNKISVVLDCTITGDVEAREQQTLTCIADDYLGEMGKMIQAMLMREMRFTSS